MSRLLEISLPIPLLLLLLMVAVAAIPDYESEDVPTNELLPDNWPDLLSQMKKLSKHDSDKRQQLIQHMIDHHIGRVGRLFYPNIFQACMIELAGNVPYERALRANRLQLEKDWFGLILDQMQEKGDPMEIELLRELGSESNQVMLANKLESLFWMEDVSYQTIGAMVQFLHVRCDYKSLPGYLFGRFLMRDASELAVFMLKDFVVPLLRPYSESVMKTIAGLLVSWGRNPGASSETMDIMPAHLLPYFVHKDPMTPDRVLTVPGVPLTLTPEQFADIRGQCDVIRALFAFGIRLDLNSVLALPDMTVAELHELVPYLSANGFERALDTYLPQGKSEVILELLRHSSLVVQLGRNPISSFSMYRACQVAIQYEAWGVLRGLLVVPEVKYYAMQLDEEWIAMIDCLRQEIAALSFLSKESLLKQLDMFLSSSAFDVYFEIDSQEHTERLC